MDEFYKKYLNKINTIEKIVIINKNNSCFGVNEQLVESNKLSEKICFIKLL